MPEIHQSPSQNNTTMNINPQNGYNETTKTYKTLRSNPPLPPISQPLSIIQYTLSLLHTKTPTSSKLSTTTFITSSSTSLHVTYSTFLQHVTSLSSSLKRLKTLRQHDVAFILSPPSLHVPTLYFSLLSLGVVVSPSNPLSSTSELSHQIKLCKPNIIFATSETCKKLPYNINVPIILLDSTYFMTMLQHGHAESDVGKKQQNNVVVNQMDHAAILYSSGTTGNVKGVVLTHRNLIAMIGSVYNYDKNAEDYVHEVSLFPLPMFHVFGFFMLIRAVAEGEGLVMLEKFDFVKMLEAVEKYKVTYMPVSPPVIVAMAKSDLVDKYDLSSLRKLACGGAPLGKDVADRFIEKFRHVEILQGYGLTESTGGATRTLGPEEAKHHGSAGRLSEYMEAKIVDPETGLSLPPGQCGELWLRGPIIMKGYAGDDAATSSTLDSEGWLKTGDLCYFDSEGYLFIVSRLKELIKYKAYQVPPAELETLLQSIPDIADAAVIPYPDEDAGEIPMAYVVRKPGSSISETQIMDIIAKQVVHYKKIRRVAFISSIPKSAAGKILRRELVTHATSAASSKL